jgi:hypothetical protein
MATVEAPRNYVGATVWEADLLEAQEGNTNGEWVCCAGVLPISIDINGISGDSVVLHGSNAKDKPAASSAGHALNSTFTQDTLAGMTIPIKWIKASVTNWIAGSINVRAFGCYQK